MSCSICWAGYDEDPDAAPPAKKVKTTTKSESALSVGKCGHVFHTMCIIQWIEKMGNIGTCPKCRKPVQKSDLRPVYFDEDATTVERQMQACKSTASGNVPPEQLLAILQKEHETLLRKYNQEKERADTLQQVLEAIEGGGGNQQARKHPPKSNDIFASSSEDEDDDFSDSSDDYY